MPPIPVEIAPHESADFDRPRRGGQALRNYERLMDWIALREEFESVETEQRMAMEEVLKGVEPPKFGQFGIQAALAEVFERFKERISDGTSSSRWMCWTVRRAVTRLGPRAEMDKA